MLLRRGCMGEDVEWLQRNLFWLNFNDDDNVDGDFGPKTEAFVKEFQQYYKLPNSLKADGTGDGIVGDETWGKLGGLIKGYQEKLRRADFYNYVVDGLAGQRTFAATRAYQMNRGLGVDGICGEQTRGSLDSSAAPSSQPTQPAPDAPVIGFRIVPRSAWGAASPHGQWDIHSKNHIVIHHAVTDQDIRDLSGDCGYMRMIQGWHFNNGWIDIGYNYIITASGRIFEGRGLLAVGAHATGHNSWGVGICLQGNFEAQQPTQAQWENLKQLVNYICGEASISKSEIYGHRDFDSTACPGQNLYSRLAELRR